MFQMEKFMAIDSCIQMIEHNYKSAIPPALGAAGITTDFVRSYVPTVQEMPDSEDLIKEQYDLIYGDWPTFKDEDYNQVVLVVDKYNNMSDITLFLLGYIYGEMNPLSADLSKSFSFEKIDKIDFSEFVGNDIPTKFYLADNDLAYQKKNWGSDLERYYFNIQDTEVAEKENFEELEVVGILRPKENVTGVLDTGLAYTTALTKHVLEENKDSNIVNFVGSGSINIYNELVPLTDDLGNIVDFESFSHTKRNLAGDDSPSNIKLYAKNFESKEAIKAHIDAWNAKYTEEDEEYIAYSDMMDMMFGMLSTMVDAVSYVLIAFTSISLVVSSVMIGIITYISVVERTKEIGVLRSLGASKFDIANVFNAETFLIGLFAGLIGIGVTYLLSIPLNLILGSLIEGVGALVILKPLHALLLVVISFALTLIAGLIPADIAAKKDPVVALRTE